MFYLLNKYPTSDFCVFSTPAHWEHIPTPEITPRVSRTSVDAFYTTFSIIILIFMGFLETEHSVHQTQIIISPTNRL